MNFKPVTTNVRAITGSKLGYAVRANTGSKPNTSSTLEISIHPDLIKRLKVKDREPLRMDADMAEGYARLTPVAGLGKSARKVIISKSSRGLWSIPYSGEIAEIFPHSKFMTELEEPECSQDGIVFKIPSK